MNDPFDLLRIHPSEDGAAPGASVGGSDSEILDSAVHAVGEELVLSASGPHGDGGDSGSGAGRSRLALLVSWAGHTDAGALNEQLSTALLDALPHKRLASFDADVLFDYRSRRPHISFAENRFTEYSGPQLELYEVKDALGQPFLLLTGDEPDFQWGRVTDTVLALVERLDVGLVVLVDALGLPTPHTRPMGVTAHGNRKDLIDGISTWGPNAQIEAGLGQVLEMRVDESGHDVVGYTLHVPHYVAGGRYPTVAVTALEYTGAALERMLPTDELRENARAVDQDIARQIGQNPEVEALVKQLEKNFDEHASTAQRSLLVNRDEEVPDAEELGAAVEAYLRSRPTQED